MSIHRLARLWPIVVLGTISACASSGDPSEKADAARKPVIREHHSVSGVAGSKGTQAGKPADIMSAITTDLSERLGAPLAEIQVVSVDPMTWNDGSLGCPQPGQSYLQALTPGMRVVMQHAGKSYEYHAASRGNFVYCPDPTRTPDGLDRQ